MVDIKHPLRKILTQELIDDLQDNYEIKQKERREKNFKAKEENLLKKAELKALGHDRIIITENPRKPNEIEKEVIKAKKELIKKVVEAEVIQEIAAEAAEEATDLIEKAILSVDYIMDNHADWINLYENETGMKAIWKGRITNGFKEFLDKNGFS